MLQENKWFVLYTKPRNELKVALHLLKRGVVVYAPYKIEIRQWSDRKKKVKTPLLPSMVLVFLKEEETAFVFEIPGVVRYLFEKGKRVTVKNDEVLAMKLYLENTDIAKKIEVGDLIKVPLLNKRATVLSLKGKKCIARLQQLGTIVTFQFR